jgi:acyl-CoA thioesterase-1
VFGDSLVSGYGLFDEDKALPIILEEIVRNDVAQEIEVIGMGVSGETTSSAQQRIHEVTEMNPDMVVIILGNNDMLRGIDPDITYTNMSNIIKHFERNGIYVLLTGQRAAPNLGYQYASDFNRIWSNLAETHNVHFVPFLLEDVAGHRELLQRDGMHPNDEGVRVMAYKLETPIIKMMQVLHATRSDEEEKRRLSGFDWYQKKYMDEEKPKNSRIDSRTEKEVQRYLRERARREYHYKKRLREEDR